LSGPEDAGRWLVRGALQAVTAAAIIGGALAVYFFAAQHPLRPPVPTRTALDDVVPLWPIFVFVYVSPYVIGPVVAAMLPPKVFRRVLVRIALLLPVQLGAYFVYPTRVIRPDPPMASDLSASLLRALWAIDTPPANAAPSGHVSLALVIAWAAWQALPRARPALAVYFTLVVVSILFTGQHHVVDLVTGALLGALVLLVASAIERRR
jgi:membrane-associated phospholipid phosphatase